MSPSVSDVAVVTVSWNGLAHLRRLLPSLVTLGAGELIVVDNGSSDGTVAAIGNEFPQVRVLANPANRGFAQPNNLAAAATECPVLALINNDMRADPLWLQAGLERLSGPVACVASRILDWEGKTVDFNGSSLQYLGYAMQLDSGAVAERVTDRDRVLFPCGGAMLIDREVFQRVGGFDESYFAIYEDVDLGWRLWLAGYEVAMAPEAVAYHRGHATFATQPNEKVRYLMHRNALMTILKNYEESTARKVFPLAVALAMRRAVTLSGAQPESLYLWAESEATLAGSLADMSRGLGEAFTQLVAVNDVLDRFPEVLARRNEVQKLRKRGDSEIIDLFTDPLRTIVEDPDYLSLEKRLGDWLEMPARLSTPEVAAAPVGPSARRLRSELDALQWLGGSALTHPPDAGRKATPRGWRRRLRALRRS